MNNIDILNAVNITNNRVKPFDGEKRYLATGDLSDQGIDDFVYVDYKNKPSRADLMVDEGDLIIARMKATNKVLLIGRDSDDLIVSTGFLTLKPKNGFIGRYLYHYFRSNLFQRLKDRLCSGATQKAINNSSFKKLKVLQYSRERQKKIIQVLDTADTIRQKRKEQLNLLDDYLKSVFFEMFGDPQVNPKNFPMQELKEFYCDDRNGTKCGPFGSALKKHEYTVEGIPVWNMDNISLQGRMISNVNLFISKEKYDQLKAYSVQNGDVIMSRAGTVGKMCVLQSPFEKSIISSNLIRVRFKTELLPQFFVALMTYCKGSVGRLKTGGDDSFTHMNTGILDKLKFPYPPIELQNKFASIVEQVEQTKQKMRASLDEMNNHFNALMQRYFG